MPARHHAGIIPAYAGNTTLLPLVGTTMTGSSPHTRGTLLQTISCARLSRDHPRIRGEHHDLLPELGAGAGIIPAYAGNTLCSLGFVCGSGDHPRIRGEHRVRRQVDDVGLGIIPAYAGNTVQALRRCLCCGGSSPHTRGTPDCYARSACRCGDHPRIRGEHAPSAFAPRPWRGIIPAYAGNTRTPRTRPATGWDHPRIRGEHPSLGGELPPL